MKDKLLELYKKHEEIVNYIIVGVMTTIFSWVVYAVSIWTFLDTQNPVELQIANILSWVAGVAFAYVTNRKYVFKSKEPDMLREFLQFSGGRVSTWVLDEVMMILMVNVLTINEAFSKIFVSVLVMIGNYIISKFFVFKK